MVAEGEIYLKICEQSAEYRVVHATPLLTMRKNGRPVLLKYYQVDETLWGIAKRFFNLSASSLQSARNEKHDSASGRLKDLPNISFHMELLLINAGMSDEKMLRQFGAEKVWLKLRESNKALTLNVLYALEGRLPACIPQRSRRSGVRSLRFGPTASTRNRCLLRLNRNLLLQPADFRQQRQQQTNLLKHQRLFAVSPGLKMLDPGLQTIKRLLHPLFIGRRVVQRIINVTDGIIKQGENFRRREFSRCAPSAEI
jgi:hypothetical protein